MPKPYPSEFRDDVVRVARNREPGVTIEQIAKDFGVHPMTPQKWLRRADIDSGAKPGQSRSEAAEITPALTKTLSETESVFAAAKDLRSLLTAYAHKVHQPRPTVAEIARAQRTSSQAIATRYTPELLAAIEVALQIDATVFDRDATREQLESAIRAGASAMDSALQSDIEDDYVLQVSRRLEREIERRPSSTPAHSLSRAHTSAREL